MDDPTKRDGRRAIKGRGALSRPPGRFERETVAALDDGWVRGEPEVTESIATSVLPERARSIISSNDSPDVPFEQSINPYRGCEHGCVYCLAPDTRILMGDGSARALAEVRIGDEIYGTVRVGACRRYTLTRVLAHWRTSKPAFRIELRDGTVLEASRDHRFLTERGWRFVGSTSGDGQRPVLTSDDRLLGFGRLEGRAAPMIAADYARGYLCGMIRRDGQTGADHRRFRLALADLEALVRAAQFLTGFGVSTDRCTIAHEAAGRRCVDAIRASSRAATEAIYRLTQWPGRAEGELARGFIAGAFDAEGSYSQGILRIANTNARYIGTLVAGLKAFGFDVRIESARAPERKPLHHVRVGGGLREHLRFFSLFSPAIGRKRSIETQAVKSTADLSVQAIVAAGLEQEFFDITTGTGDFIADGVVSHNCFARPSHAYVGLSPGLDFETKLLYKADAARLLETELSRPGYRCRTITLGANTDPYQPVERRLRVTRSLLEVFARHRHPVGIVTKGALIDRDVDILADLARDRLASVMVSLPTLDDALKRTLEPRAAAPQARLRIMRTLKAAGVPVGVLVAPVIPVLTDHELEAILEASQAAGATSAGYILLRLPYEVKDLFREWLGVHQPGRAAHVMSLVRQQRGERDNDPGFGTRMRGTGPLAELLGKRFDIACRRLGLTSARTLELDTTLFRPPPRSSAQLELGL